MGFEDRHLAIDLHDLSFIDSTGLGMLAGALKRARQQGRTVVLVAPQPAVRTVLEITSLTLGVRGPGLTLGGRALARRLSAHVS